jgi:MinD superfamily P-loop ATPase
VKQLTVISGKGGTGKTSLTAALASLAQNCVLVDADVDAADLHLLLSPRIQHREAFFASRVAEIDPQLCNRCGKCLEVCRFEAITDFTIDPIACEGCRVCAFICPQGAVRMKEIQSGEWFISETRLGPLVHAKLGVAQENSGKLVTQVRREAQRMAKERDLPLILIDGPPGIGCPVIASLGGVDAALVVTEPSVSGIHDLQRVLGICRHFQVPARVCINKADINLQKSEEIQEFCNREGSPVIGVLPYDPVFTEAIVARKTVVEFDRKGIVTERIQNLWKALKPILREVSPVHPKERPFPIEHR